MIKLLYSNDLNFKKLNKIYAAKFFTAGPLVI